MRKSAQHKHYFTIVEIGLSGALKYFISAAVSLLQWQSLSSILNYWYYELYTRICILVLVMGGSPDDVSENLVM